jgi:hypothetical protein
MAAYTSLLAPRQAGGGYAITDKDNLRGLVRMAGGRHVETGRLALWIDSDSGELFDVEDQILLMKSGYSSEGTAASAVQEFEAAAEELAQFLENRARQVRHLPLPTISSEISLYLAAQELKENPIVEAFSRAEDEWGIGASANGPFESATSQPLRSIPAAVPGEWKSSSGLRAWAQKIWETPLDAGCFWSWISEAGFRGITAAKVLFGEDALDRLIAKVQETPGIPVQKVRERIYKVRQLFENHHMPVPAPPETISGNLSPEAEALIPEIITALHQHKRIQDRNRADVEHLIYVLLLAFQTSGEGYIDVSLDKLAASIVERWPDQACDRSSINRYLKRMQLGCPECGFSLLEEIQVNRAGMNPPRRFRPGPDLRATSWGKALSLDNCVDFSPRRGRVMRAGRLTTVHYGQTPQRGRKPKGHTSGA